MTEKKGIDLDALQGEAEKLLGLLKDRQMGHFTWHEFFQERLKNIYTMAFAAGLPSVWHNLLAKGWRVEPTSCVCGGQWAWLDPNGMMHGCVCHHTPSV
jgi:hypothetical protein